MNDMIRRLAACVLAFALLLLAAWTGAAAQPGGLPVLGLAGMLSLCVLTSLKAWKSGLVAMHARTSLQSARSMQKEWDRMLCLTGDLFCLVGPDGRARSLSAAWESVLGFSVAEVAGRSFLEFTHPWTPEVPFDQCLASGPDGLIVRFESRAPCKSGASRWLSWTVQFFPTERVCYAVAQDIDEKRKAADALADRCDELARSNAELEQFAYVASHDLQEPLRMVSNYTQLLAEKYRGQMDAKAERFIHYAVDGASRMQALIQALLALARVNFRGQDFRPVPTEDVLREALENLETAIGEAGAIVTTGPLPVVYGNRAYLVQVLQNLLTNALKFRADRQLQIHISARQDDLCWTIALSDNGIGIAPEHCTRIFGIFERLHSRSRYPGTGIGLALCRKIVELHRGKIWVDSRPDSGSTFYFTLSDARVAAAA